ncbi:MAG: hypothetical protein ACQESG_05220 [Nanobdellota archaeon]
MRELIHTIYQATIDRMAESIHDHTGLAFNELPSVRLYDEQDLPLLEENAPKNLSSSETLRFCNGRYDPLNNQILVNNYNPSVNSSELYNQLLIGLQIQENPGLLKYHSHAISPTDHCAASIELLGKRLVLTEQLIDTWCMDNHEARKYFHKSKSLNLREVFRRKTLKGSLLQVGGNGDIMRSAPDVGQVLDDLCKAELKYHEGLPVEKVFQQFRQTTLRRQVSYEYAKHCECDLQEDPPTSLYETREKYDRIAG